MADNTVLNAGTLGDTIRDIDKGGVKTQVVALDAGGSGTESLATFSNPFPIQPAASYFQAGTGNTSTTQLAASATFTGTIENTLSQPAVSLLINCDQPCTLTLNQYIDAGGTYKTAAWTYNLLANQDFAQSFTLNANYFNLTLQNTGAATTTTLNINTYYGTIGQAGIAPMQGSVPVVIASDQTPVGMKLTDGTNTILLDQINNDTVATTEYTLPTEAYGMVFNGTTWDRKRSGGLTGSTMVAGGAANGTAVAGNPVLVAGSDGTNARNIAVDASGRATVVGVTGASSLFVQGAAASAATIAGNPVLQGFTFTTTLPTVTTGQAVNAQSTARGEQLVALSNGAVAVSHKAASTAAAFTDVALVVDARPGGALVSASAAMADALANPTLGQQAVLNSVFNGTTWDRQRGMGLASTTGDTGAKTATGNGATLTNVGNKGVQIVVNMGAVTGTTPTCTIKVQGSLDGGTTWYDIPGATTASLTATGVYAIAIYPGAPTVAGTTTSISGSASCGQMLPRTWRMVWTIGGTTPSFTITNIQYIYIPN